MILSSEPFFVENDSHFLLGDVPLFHVVRNLKVYICVFDVVIEEEQAASVNFKVRV